MLPTGGRGRQAVGVGELIELFDRQMSVLGAQSEQVPLENTPVRELKKMNGAVNSYSHKKTK
jgi:hypothetical protein